MIREFQKKKMPKLSQNQSEIVLFKSLRNYKIRNKLNFTLKSNSNKMMLCGGQHHLVLNKISTL